MTLSERVAELEQRVADLTEELRQEREHKRHFIDLNDRLKATMACYESKRLAALSGDPS